MWDAFSGRFYPDLGIPAIQVGPFGPAASLLYAGEEHHADSSLLVVDACFEDTCDCAKRYYVWRGGKLRLVLRTPEKLPPECMNSGRNR
jgi:hypothetical protein